MQLVIVGVWITSAIYSLPKFIYVHTVTMQVDQAGRSETFCAPNRQIYNSEVFDMINFGFLYVTPLLVMTVSKLDRQHKQLINNTADPTGRQWICI